MAPVGQTVFNVTAKTSAVGAVPARLTKHNNTPSVQAGGGSCSSGWQPIGVSANLTDNWLRESDVIKE